MAASVNQRYSRGAAKGFVDWVLPVADVSLNWLLRNYVGMHPRRPHELIIPRFVVIERGRTSFVKHLERFIDLKTLKRPVVVADETTWRITGSRLFEELDQLHLAPQRILVGGNRYSEVGSAVRALSHRPRFWAGGWSPLDPRLCAAKRTSILFAVGGGSVIDVAKLAARQLHVPCVSVPTSLANDGIASPFAVIDPEGTIPDLAQVTVRTNTPLGVIVDLSAFSDPAASERSFVSQMIRSGIGDVISNITAVMDWELAATARGEELDYAALLQSRSAGEVILHRVAEGAPLEDESFLLTLAAALISSGEAMTRVGSSRPASGFEHKLYHAFSNLLRFSSGASHGVLVAVGTLIAAAAHERSYEQIRKAFERAALPVDARGLAEYSIDPDQVARAIEEAGRIKPERYTILEEVGPERMVAVFRDVYGLG
jgi:glycerol-1-phosphate dehydrogenase [NAD(P)+]